MQARALAASLFGVTAVPVTIEADVGGGLPRFTIVGLPDSAVREAAERVRTAIQRSGLEWPAGRITVNLAPANLRKGGSGLDLGIAVALLAAMEKTLKPTNLAGGAFFGEISLSGEVRPLAGALAAARAARAAGASFMLTAVGCAPEAALVPGLPVYAVASLADAVRLLALDPAKRGEPVGEGMVTEPEIGPADLADVRGQPRGRRALEVAAAGGHNLLLFGPPGAGKTMLARRLPGLLPRPDRDESLEITLIASCAGLTSGRGLVRCRPFRAPHHTLTGPALVGGGSVPRPGEVSLAHGGVLFLDEMAEFRRDVLERLRQPLEEGQVALSRAGRMAVFPSRFLLVAATNPCPCGYQGDSRRPCTCTPPAVTRYRGRISGPLLDRIDLHVEVPRVAAGDLIAATSHAESSDVVRARVVAARAIQASRYRETHYRVNADVDGAEVRRHCRADAPGLELLARAITALSLSARAHDRILKVARTLADLAGQEIPGASQVAEAIAFRALDRPQHPEGGGYT